MLILCENGAKRLRICIVAHITSEIYQMMMNLTTVSVKKVSVQQNAKGGLSRKAKNRTVE